MNIKISYYNTSPYECPSHEMARTTKLLFSFRLMNAKGLHASVGCNVALLEYRGYGRSDGSPSEEGMYLDAQVKEEEIF
jgi:hypothetical protein